MSLPSVTNARDIAHDESLVGKMIALDTNILIAICDARHEFHASTVDALSKASAKGGVHFGYTVATRLELLEYMRREALYQWIIHNAADASQTAKTIGEHFWRVAHGIYVRLTAESQRSGYVSDGDFKDLRTAFFQDNPAKQAHWVNLCGLMLAKPLTDADDALIGLSIRGISLSDESLFPRDATPAWSKQKELMIRFGLGSNDASILNMVNTPGVKIAGLMTNDFDIIQVYLAAGLRDGLMIFTLNPRFAGLKMTNPSATPTGRKAS